MNFFFYQINLLSTAPHLVFSVRKVLYSHLACQQLLSGALAIYTLHIFTFYLFKNKECFADFCRSLCTQKSMARQSQLAQCQGFFCRQKQYSDNLREKKKASAASSNILSIFSSFPSVSGSCRICISGFDSGSRRRGVLFFWGLDGDGYIKVIIYIKKCDIDAENFALVKKAACGT